MAAPENDDVALDEVGFEPPESCPNSGNSLMQRLKSALWLSIGKIVDDETLKLGVDATPQFIGALTEMVWAQIGV